MPRVTHWNRYKVHRMPLCAFFRWENCPRRCVHSDCVALWKLNFQYGGESNRNWQILTKHSVKGSPFLFRSTIGKCNLIYSDCVKVFFIRICRVFYGSQRQTRSLVFLVCNLGPVFEKVKIDVRGSLEPFKDLDGRFNPSSTPPSKPTVHVFLAF